MIRKYQVDTNQVREDINAVSGDRYFYEIQIKEESLKIKRLTENTNKLKKENEKLKKNYKREELFCK